MQINDLLKIRNNEKKDCKVSTNGVIWLRKGEYSTRIKSNNGKDNKHNKIEKTAAELLIDQVQSLQKREPNYIAENSNTYYRFRNKDKSQGTYKRKLYSVNKRKVRARLQNFINTEQGEKRMYFYSISFPKGMEENVAYKLLNSVLTSLRKDHAVEHYLWVAERQKNGTIHYHVAIYHFIKVRIVNELVKKYIKHGVRKKEIGWSAAAANNYNGVDIAKDRKSRVPTNFSSGGNEKRIAKYITKYITKCSTGFTHQAWNSSRSLAAISDGICCTIEEVLTMYSSEILSDNASYKNEWCYYFRWKKEAPNCITELMKEINTERVKNVSLPLRGFGIVA